MTYSGFMFFGGNDGDLIVVVFDDDYDCNFGLIIDTVRFDADDFDAVHGGLFCCGRGWGVLCFCLR